MHLKCTTTCRCLTNGTLRAACSVSTTQHRHRAALKPSKHFVRHTSRNRTVQVRAQEDEIDEDAALEKRIADLERRKGGTSRGEGNKKASEKANTKPDTDFSTEVVFYEGSPHSGDLAVNLALGVTILWLPLTFASIGRKIFVRYRFTDKRISVMTTAPWENRQTDVVYTQVRDVVAVGRGVGIWGDMVITLKNGDKIEIRSLDKWKEIKDYIIKKKTEADSATSTSNQGKQTPVGF